MHEVRSMSEDAIFAAVKRNLLLVIPDLDGLPISIDDTLAGLGCNSIDRLDVVAMTLEDLAVRVPVHALQQAGSIRGLVELLRQYV